MTFKDLNDQYKQVTDYLKAHDCVTNKAVQDILNVGQTRAYTIIKEMLNMGLIKKNDGGNYILS